MPSSTDGSPSSSHMWRRSTYKAVKESQLVIGYTGWELYLISISHSQCLQQRINWGSALCSMYSSYIWITNTQTQTCNHAKQNARNRAASQHSAKNCEKDKALVSVISLEATIKEKSRHSTVWVHVSGFGSDKSKRRRSNEARNRSTQKSWRH